MTCGFSEKVLLLLLSSSSFSISKEAISAFNKMFNSLKFEYFSSATLDSILSIIFKVVLTPTSLEIKTSSRLSNTSESILVFPVTSLFNFEKNDWLDFFKPLLSVSFFFFENIFLKKLSGSGSVSASDSG